MYASQNFTECNDIDPRFVAEVLQPYKDHCKYLKHAQVRRHPRETKIDSYIGCEPVYCVEGEFSIQQSCYIADTGHFNSVEFNICYNQLAYVLVAHLLDNQLLDALRDWNLETYRRRQLADCLIVRFNSVFRKSIDPTSFLGVLSIDKWSARGSLVILSTTCSFFDEHGGRAHGDVTLAILKRKLLAPNPASNSRVAA